jgi:hypothetical protein
MKTRLSMIAAAVSLFFAAQAAMALTIAPTFFKIKGGDAKVMITALENSGLQEQSAIESSFFQADEAFCENSSRLKTCQFSVGGGLFVATDVDDADAFIKVLRKNAALSRAVEGGRRWELRNLECSTRFDLVKRQVVSTCTFEQ